MLGNFRKGFDVASVVALVVIIVMLIWAGIYIHNIVDDLTISYEDSASTSENPSEETLQKLTDAGFVLISSEVQPDDTYQYTIIATNSIGKFPNDEAAVKTELYRGAFRKLCVKNDIPLSVVDCRLPSYRYADTVKEQCNITDTSAWLSTQVSSGMHWCIDKDKNLTYGEDMYSYECFPVLIVTEHVEESK